MNVLNDIYRESPTKSKSRLKIVDNAFKLFSEKGFDSFSLNDIAVMSDITIRNLYRYYSSKEALITDVAFYYISVFNGNFPLSVNDELSGYEQLEDILDNQIGNKLLSKSNSKVIAFIGYFDIYMSKSNLEHESIANYINVYSPILKENILITFRKALVKGTEDNTLNLEPSEVDVYVGYIYLSIMSLMSRIAVKHYQANVKEYDFTQKHIDVLLGHLKK